MDWSIFAMLQMGVIAAGVSVACWMRYRGAAQQNQALRAHCDALAKLHDTQAAQLESHNDAHEPHAWIAARIEQLSDDDPTSAIVRTVLEHQLDPSDADADKLSQVVAGSGLIEQSVLSGDPDAALTSRIEELEQALVEAQSAGHPDLSGAEHGDLKKIILQFTQDSREMMACIQTLEEENADLRGQLGIAAEDVESAA